MFNIRKATIEDIEIIRALAKQTFPVTYQKILTPEQIDYMMEWMYSAESLIRIHPAGRARPLPLAEDLCAPLLPEIQTRTATVRAGHQRHQGTSPGTLPDGAEREPSQSGTGIL